ncbi:FAD-dependent oxidoreductase [Schlegelella sp. S2-27]|uniref:FAD-dependent oxidoreductase n=1 Tax=Caldimonas mangrovi TaxID=2944811 RepID=A0ABT0YIT8_9BURK|nr:FAD-dependent oxidoreductase [Caldimonas mangrovi]MCM5678651.1 FAD-dependent oxidoreductase [Caldimonas mangrovi]
MPQTSMGAPVDYQALEFAYRRCADQDPQACAHHPVVVVGAGPVGLSLAIDLAQQNVPVVLLDNDCRLSTGSRAICFAKRTLEIFDRLGCGDRMVAKGVSWNVGKVFFRHEQIYQFDLLPESGHERPAFINLQQYYCEGYLAERAMALPLIDMRWKNKVVAVEPQGDRVLLTVETPDGTYRLQADYVAACDGSRSSVRQMVGQESKGRVFQDRFLIADVRMKAHSPASGRAEPGDRPPGGQHDSEAASAAARGFPAERWFWFDPPFHRNQSVLLHMQPDGVWRIDFQLGWGADPEEARKPENVIPRVKALLGEDVPFELEWVSVYTFSCLRMERFRHGRVLFAGDAAHLVSPFGARGANSGVQDAENLAWKLALVLRGQAPDALLDSYAQEREYAADENIRHSTRATDFITPKSEISRLFRDAVLDLAKDHAFARSLVNSGRLSVPATLHGSSLNTVDGDEFVGRLVPGAPACDAPVRRLTDGHDTWFLRQLGSGVFTAVVFSGGAQTASWVRAVQAAARGLVPLDIVLVVPPGQAAPDVPDTLPLLDSEGLLHRRYDARPGTVYLLRPDQHVCARLRHADAAPLQTALRRALCLE